jgi:hypothetical protein
MSDHEQVLRLMADPAAAGASRSEHEAAAWAVGEIEWLRSGLRQVITATYRLPPEEVPQECRRLASATLREG